MAKALHKVRKQISKKRGGKPNALHENSRDARRLRTAGAREDKLARIASVAARSNQIYINRVAWMRDCVEGANEPLSDSSMRKLVEDFIAREDAELAELQAAQRPGRPKSKAEERIQLRKDAEMNQFKSGFWAPDLRDKDVLENIGSWKEDWGGLGHLKFVRVHEDGEIKESSFPPKALS